MDVYEIYAGDTLCAVYDGKLKIINKEIAPLFLEDFREWVSSRAISDLRGFTSRNIKRASGLSAISNSFETSLKAHCACVTDNYWVKKRGETISYTDVNFDNYRGELYKLALGLDSDYHRYRNSKSPELTNIGNSNKAWNVDANGIRWLYKRQPLKECFHEVLASKIAEVLGIDTVEYELVSYSEDPEEGRWGIVRSGDFTQGRGVNLEPANFVLEHYGIEPNEIVHNTKLFSLYGCEKEFLNLQYLDIITGNADRHQFNYGLLKNQADGAIIGPAPNFDNNFAFLSDLPTDEFAWVAGQYGWSRPYLTEKKKAKILEEIKEIDAFRSYDIEGLLRSVEDKQDYLYERLTDLRNLEAFENFSRSDFDSQKTVFVRGHSFRDGYRHSHWRRPTRNS